MGSKTDAELIEEAERRSGILFFGSYDALKNIELAVELASRLKAANEIIYWQFVQACDHGGIYNHECISAYENAQRHLVREGRIKQEECQYDVY